MLKLKRLLKSFSYAVRGFRKTFHEEQNLQVQASVGLIAIFASFLFGLDRIEFSIIIFLIILVLLMELANSAVERIADLLKPRINTYVKEIKDIMAAAVLLASIGSVIIGILIFWPHVFKL
jgi:diacylglycerol kinase